MSEAKERLSGELYQLAVSRIDKDSDAKNAADAIEALIRAELEPYKAVLTGAIARAADRLSAEPSAGGQLGSLTDYCPHCGWHPPGHAKDCTPELRNTPPVTIDLDKLPAGGQRRCEECETGMGMHDPYCSRKFDHQPITQGMGYVREPESGQRSHCPRCGSAKHATPGAECAQGVMDMFRPFDEMLAEPSPQPSAPEESGQRRCSVCKDSKLHPGPYTCAACKGAGVDPQPSAEAHECPPDRHGCPTCEASAEAEGAMDNPLGETCSNVHKDYGRCLAPAGHAGMHGNDRYAHWESGTPEPPTPPIVTQDMTPTMGLGNFYSPTPPSVGAIAQRFTMDAVNGFWVVREAGEYYCSSDRRDVAKRIMEALNATAPADGGRAEGKSNGGE